ncbi:hypothetical protein ABEB36_008955 [Hypothenemus hampei]|uniref:Regulatory protein zeste n=1 Tax=Hypothenemus hampei TaxID=57062 RepID=A0ABD1ENM4_HYPHA
MEEQKRFLNFNKDEIDLLVSLVEKYSSILECKKSDSVEWKRKNEVWEILTREFNNHNLKQNRNSKNLREKWKNIKKDSKKKFSNEKLATYKRGDSIITTSKRKSSRSTQLTNDCRTKINLVSQAKLELIKLQTKCLQEEHQIKLKEYQIKAKNVEELHKLEIEEKKIPIEILKTKIRINLNK